MSWLDPAEVLSWFLPKCRRCKERHERGPCPVKAFAPVEAQAPAKLEPRSAGLPAPAPPVTHLALRRIDPVDGWSAYEDSEAGHWFRDLDLAERAGMGKPRDIKTTIRGAIKEGMLSDWRRHAGANNVPMFREVVDVVRSGKGRKQNVPTYYLNREGTVLVLQRLRTRGAERAVVGATIAALRVFDALKAGVLGADAEATRAELVALRAEVAALRGLPVEVARLRERIDASDEAAERHRFDGQPGPLSPSKPQSHRRQLQGAYRRAIRGLSPSASDADANAAVDDFNARVAQVRRRAAAIDRALLDRTPLPLFPDPAPWSLPFLPVVRVPIDRAHHRLHAVEVAFRDAVPLCVSPPDEFPPHGRLMPSMVRELGSLTCRVEVVERNFLERSGLTATAALEPAPPTEPDPAPAAPRKAPLAPLTSKEMAAVAAEADVGTYVVLRRLKGFSMRAGTRERVDRALRLLGYAEHIPDEELPVTPS